MLGAGLCYEVAPTTGSALDLHLEDSDICTVEIDEMLASSDSVA